MKKWKRVIAVLCALVCILGVSVPAFAAVTYTTFSKAQTASGLLLPAAFGDTVHLDEAGNLLVSVSFDTSTSSQKEAAKEAWAEIMKDWKGNSDYYFFYSFGKASSSSVACFTLYAFPKSSFSHISNKTDVRNYYHAYFTAGFRFQFDLRNSALLFSGFNGHFSEGFTQGICLYPSSTKIYFFKSIADLDLQHNFPPTVASLSDVNSVIVTDDILVSPEPQTYTLTVNYRYENGSQAAQPFTRSLTAGSSYEITSPIIEGHTADRPIVSGTMPEEDLTVTVTYTAVPPPEPQTYNLTINYRYENGSQAAQPVTRSLTAGSSYEIISPAIEGYTADKPVVSGTMPAEDLTVTVTYTAVPPPEPQTYNLTVNYRYENGSQAAQSVTRLLTAGSSYEITSPAIEGYTADKPVVSGTMPGNDLTLTVTYTAVPPPEPQTYNLTVNYRYENGSQAAQSVTRSLTAGSSYEITSPTIKGYTADRTIVSGIMPERDLTVHVLYRKDSSGSSSSSGKFPDVAAGVEWKDPLTWFDIAEGVEWKDPLTWFDIADGVEWKDPLTWFDIAEGVEWIDPFNYDWG